MKDNISFHYINPTGNITILVDSPVSREDYINTAADLSKKYPLCEQVGYISYEVNGAHIRLDMAAGEFCGNATMSTAALYARKKGLEPGKELDVIVSASGTRDNVNVKITCIDSNFYKGTVKMPVPGGIKRVKLSLDGKEYEYPMVMFEGISHIIAEDGISRETAEKAIVKWCKELALKGLGIMLLNEEDKKLDPLVYVPELDSLFWENSCASGTTATGWFLHNKYGKSVEITFTEPGGELNIKTDEKGIPYLSGIVRFEKTLILDKQ